MADALSTLFSVQGIFLILLGTALGIFVGAIPGLTGVMLIALVLPLTYTMDPLLALTLLIAIYVGAISGGMVTSTLLRMPGTPASIVTTFDGYPMAKKGQPERALGLGVMASFVGGLISWGFLVLLAKPIAKLSLNFGPWEYFTLVLMALVLIATIGGKSLSKSLFAGFLGILLSMPGMAAATGQTRLTFNLPQLNDGFKLLPVLIGLFAVNQIFREIINSRKTSKAPAIHTKGAKIRLKDFAQHGVNMVRSSIIGTWIGLLPGIGANIGSVTSYSVAKSTSKTPEKFGTGHEDGVVAAEAANNATIGGALIPLVAMGIPGSVVEAVLLGALIVHGLQPGPRLFTDSPSMVYTIMGAMVIANFAMAAIMLVSMRFLAKLAKIPLPYLMPLILAFCIIGAFALNNRVFDIWVMLGFGLLGFLLESKNIPLAPFVIGFVLGPIAEENLTIALISETPIFSRPISIVFIAVAVIMLVLPVFKKIRHQSKLSPA
ncbi:MAG: tripartite tricarboxylate transporter permease [Akkermansiaceae bacterium]